MTDTYARRLFSIAAAFNFVVGLPFLFAMPQLAELTGMRPVPSEPLMVHLAAVLVLTFGWGYWRISRDPVANRPIIHMGVVGKSAVVLAGFADWFLGNTNWVFPALLVGDAIFATLFVQYLIAHPLQAGSVRGTTIPTAVRQN